MVIPGGLHPGNRISNRLVEAAVLPIELAVRLTAAASMTCMADHPGRPLEAAGIQRTDAHPTH
jgi:hypothetical protein